MRQFAYLVRDRKLDRLECGKLHVFQILAALLLQLLVEGVVGILQRERILPATIGLQIFNLFVCLKLRFAFTPARVAGAGNKSETRTTVIFWWMRSSRVVKTSDCQCRSRKSPGFNPSILRHSRIWGAADEAVLNNVRKKINKKINPL